MISHFVFKINCVAATIVSDIYTHTHKMSAVTLVHAPRENEIKLVNRVQELATL